MLRGTQVVLFGKKHEFQRHVRDQGLIMKGSFAEAKKCVSSKTLQLFSVKEIHYKDAEYIEKVEDEEVTVF